MKKFTRIALGSAVLAGGLAIAGASSANAQVRVRGSFPLPHGRLSINIGAPVFPVGGYVPYGYNVYEDPEYGYGFEYDNRWIPCEPQGTRWIVVERPYYGYGGGYGGDYRYSRPYRGDSYGYSRDYRRQDDYRSYSRDNRSYGRDNRSYGRDNRSYTRDNRSYGRDNRSYTRDNRSYSRDDRRSNDSDRRSRDRDGDRRWRP